MPVKMHWLMHTIIMSLTLIYLGGSLSIDLKGSLRVQQMSKWKRFLCIRKKVLACFFHREPDYDLLNKEKRLAPRLIPLIPLILTFNSDQKFTHLIPTQPKNKPKPKKQTENSLQMRRGEKKEKQHTRNKK